MRIPKKPYYVTMTDSFMSGWGMARGRTAKFVVGVDNYAQAQRIARNARCRSEMKYVNIVRNKPRYDPRRYQVTYRDYSQLGMAWKR